MGKSKTKLLEEAIKIIETDGGFEADAVEKVKELSKDNLILWIKQHKDINNEPTSAPDPEPSDTTSQPASTEFTTSTPKPKAEKTTGNFISQCNGCGLHQAGKLRSCPTDGCEGTITILEA